MTDGVMNSFYEGDNLRVVHPLPRELAPLLKHWFYTRGRDYAWRRSTEPFQVLMAVFMLQRTGASQVAQVYGRFAEVFPGVEDLTSAAEEELLAALRPLGRLGRVRQLKCLAEAIAGKHNGRVPDDLTQLDALPGVGHYTARAVLCLAYRRPYIMLDPNSYRVLSRCCGVKSTTKRPHTDRKLIEALDAEVPLDDPVAFNLALLDLGSQVCTRLRPNHDLCPLAGLCRFHLEGAAA